MRPTAVLFDLDGVLADVDYGAATSFFAPLLPLSLPELGRYWQGWLAERADALPGAAIWSHFWDDLANQFALRPEARRELHAFDYRTLYRAYPDALPALDWARRRGLRKGVLSNTPLADLRDLLGSLGLSDLVDRALFPRQTGVAKPAAAAYRRALDALEVSSEECLFFDDEPENVNGARLFGMRAFLVDRRRDTFGPPAPDTIRALDAVPGIICALEGTSLA